MSNQTQATQVAAQGEREIVAERVFDAPRERVFQTYTDPELIPQWWGPRAITTTVEKMDVRVGGDWRFICEGPDGTTAFRGTYREISPPGLVEQTFEWEGMPGHVLVERAEFEDLGDGRTKVTTRSLFHTTEERDGMLASGMESGLSESHERLDELLAAGSED
jgi:uncharacterized protein YndB with AHSA1/START domain